MRENEIELKEKVISINTQTVHACVEWMVYVWPLCVCSGCCVCVVCMCVVCVLHVFCVCNVWVLICLCVVSGVWCV